MLLHLNELNKYKAVPPHNCAPFSYLFFAVVIALGNLFKAETEHIDLDLNNNHL